MSSRSRELRSASTASSNQQIKKKSTAPKPVYESDPEKQRIREILHKHLADEEKYHAYQVRNVLAAGEVRIKSRTPNPNADSETPFKGMKSVLASNTNIGKDTVMVKQRHFTRPHSITEKEIAIQPAKIIIEDTSFPRPKKCREYVTLRDNLIANDEEEMRYLPYFGEGAGDNDLDELQLAEVFVDKIKESVEEGKLMEACGRYASFVSEFLDEVESSDKAVAHYSNLKNPRMLAQLEQVPEIELKRAGKVCSVFKEITKVALWEVVRRMNVDLDPPETPVKETLPSICPICFTIECPRHNIVDPLDLSDNELDHDYVANRVSAYKEGEACSPNCFVKDKTAKPGQPRMWTEVQLDMLRHAAKSLRGSDRIACLSSPILNQPCFEVQRMLKVENLLQSKRPTPATDTSSTTDAAPKRKRGGPTNPYLPGYPVDTDKTHLYHERTEYRPCTHRGPCDRSCICVQARVTCEKICACRAANCDRRWRGCSCARTGRPCSTEKCICFKANRECDPDLCGTCGSGELLNPITRNNFTAVPADMCQNVMLQRGVSKKTFLGHSNCEGMGLYIGEDAAEGEFLGEYKGEIVTDSEAERRGKIYDKRGQSFVFNLNLTENIDATRMGNKFRFINHSSTMANCAAKVVMANCVQRIGFHATRPLHAGEELYFDYGYKQKAAEFVHKEPPPIPEAAWNVDGHGDDEEDEEQGEKEEEEKEIAGTDEEEDESGDIVGPRAKRARRSSRRSNLAVRTK